MGRCGSLLSLTGDEAYLLAKFGQEVERVLGAARPEDRRHAHDRHPRPLQLGEAGEELVDAPGGSPGSDADLGGVALTPLRQRLQLRDVARQLADVRPRSG